MRFLQDAGVARRSLYQHFGGKDGLIAETLRTSADVDEQRYRDALESGGEDPQQRLLAVFRHVRQDNHLETFPRLPVCSSRSRAQPIHEHPAHAETRAYKERLRALFHERARSTRTSNTRPRRRPDPAANRRRPIRRRDTSRGPPSQGRTRTRRTHPGRQPKQTAQTTPRGARDLVDRPGLFGLERQHLL